MTFPPPVIDRLDRPGEVCTWIGNIGLMRLSDLQKRKGGWVASKWSTPRLAYGTTK